MTNIPLVWINGFPGTGKLTIARLLAEIAGNEEMVLIDNHQLIDPVEAKIPRYHPDYQKERLRQRGIAFEQCVMNTAMRSRVIVFTGGTAPAMIAFPPSSSGD